MKGLDVVNKLEEKAIREYKKYMNDTPVKNEKVLEFFEVLGVLFVMYKKEIKEENNGN